MTDTKLTKERVEKLMEWVDRRISRYRYFWPAEDQSFATDLHFLLRSHAVALGEHPQSGERPEQEKAGAKLSGDGVHDDTAAIQAMLNSSIKGYPDSVKRALAPFPGSPSTAEDERGMTDEMAFTFLREAIQAAQLGYSLLDKSAEARAASDLEALAHLRRRAGKEGNP